MAKIIEFPTDNVSLGQAIGIVKFGLNDLGYSTPQKVKAIERVANMETHNSITKNELISALRFLFEYYDF